MNGETWPSRRRAPQVLAVWMLQSQDAAGPNVLRELVGPWLAGKHVAQGLLFSALLLSAHLLGGSMHGGVVQADDPSELFRRRIEPILASPEPSSCTECHLAGVDLKNYILPTAEETFRSLRDLGLIDVAHPKRSKILKFIRRRIDRDSAPSASSNLVRPEVRQQELEAFTAWIEAACADPHYRNLPPLAPEKRALPSRPVEVIRHSRRDRLLERFEQTVWAQRYRCMGCHAATGPENARLVKEHGERVTWIIAGDPQQTMQHLLDQGLVDLHQPENSMLLLKPLNEIEHGGGQKMLPGDQGYKAFRHWIEDCAAIMADRYASAADLPEKLPATRSFPSEIWLKLENTPADWADRLLQVDVFAWDARRKVWEPRPVATSDRMVFGAGRLWQHSLLLLAEPGSQSAQAFGKQPRLPAGKYLLRVYVDTGGLMQQDWRRTWTAQDIAGSLEIETAWPPGYGSMTIVDANQLKPATNRD